MSGIPPIDRILALDGKIFAMLSPAELEVFDFYRAQGRKFGVQANVVSDADPQGHLDRTISRRDDEILRQTNSRVSVAVESGAQAEWAKRQRAGSAG